MQDLKEGIEVKDNMISMQQMEIQMLQNDDEIKEHMIEQALRMSKMIHDLKKEKSKGKGKGKGKFQVSVKTLDGQTLSIKTGATDTITNVKAKIQDLTGIPPNQLRLIFAGKQLEDAGQLANHGVTNQSTIFTVLGAKRKLEVPMSITESPHDHSVTKQMIGYFSTEWPAARWEEVLKQLTLLQLLSFRETINTRLLGIDGKAVRIFDIFAATIAMKASG